MSEQMKINVGVIFGGRSVEHEVSIISAHQAIAAMNADKYHAVPIYISRKGNGIAEIFSSILMLLKTCLSY